GTRGAAGRTPAAVDAGGPAIIRGGVDGNRWSEGMRAEGPGAARQQLGVPVHRVRWHRQRVRLRRKRAALAGHPKFALHPGVMLAEVVVADGPVGSDALAGVGAKVETLKTGHHPKPCQGAAAYTDAHLGHDPIATREDARL